MFLNGFWGEKLQTEVELEENRKRGGGGTIHFMRELPEYKNISDKYFEEERKLEEYKSKCKDTAFDLLKEHFYKKFIYRKFTIKYSFFMNFIFT